MSSSSSWVDTRSSISCFTSEVVRIYGAAGAILLVSSTCSVVDDFSSDCSEVSGEGEYSCSGDSRAVENCVGWVSAIELGC